MATIATEHPPRGSIPSRLLTLATNDRTVGVLLLIAVTAGTATYATLTATPPFGDDPDTVFLLLNIDLAVLLILGAVVVHRLIGLWAERRRGGAGSRLHVRLVAAFSLVAVIPAILVAGFSALFFYFGVQTWFSERVQTAVQESLSVAEAYLVEHQQVIRGEVYELAGLISQEAARLIGDGDLFNRFLTAQGTVRNLPEAMVIDGSGRILARSALTFSLQFEPMGDDALELARLGEAVILSNDAGDRVRALVKLDRFIDTFLVVGRLVEPQVIAHMERAQGAVDDYLQLQQRTANLHITFTLIYIIVALLLMLVATWIGIRIADSLARPVSALIDAAERLRGGDLSARVPDMSGKDEVGILSRTFNRMADQLGQQREELIDANRQIDSRRRFTEAVLVGVSAGVIGLDGEGRIELTNPSALELLATTEAEVVAKHIVSAMPEIADAWRQAAERRRRDHEWQIDVFRGGVARTLLVRISAETRAPRPRGYVVTFDDISDLVQAQRKAAWSDVARRIAHEIKNPLTPIQLSAERLKRRYLKQIDQDPETFISCTDTIVRQVGDIGRMVDEFAAFARMPTPKMTQADMRRLVAAAATLQRTARPDISVNLIEPTEAGSSADWTIICDGGQVAQVFNNILGNAVEAIDGRREEDGAGGRIDIRLLPQADGIDVVVEDDGIGLPVDLGTRLTEPYVTTKSKGTGLGLAIVKKILEDHGGGLALTNRPDGGASVRLIFRRDPANMRAGTSGPILRPDVGLFGRIFSDHSK